MDLNHDIRPLTDFKRKTPEFLARLKRSGRPVVLTVNGRAALVVQDAASYQTLFDLAERLKAVTGRSEPGAALDALEREIRARDEPRDRPA